MKLKRCAPCAVAVLMLTGCDKKPDLIIQKNDLLQTAFPVVKPGDTIHFRDVKGNGFEPEFKLPGPCAKTPDLKAGICVVRDDARKTLYPYSCPGCEDPEIMVGSDIVKRELDGAATRAAARVLFGCDPGHPVKIVQGEPLQVSAASPGSVVWILSGDGSQPGWTVEDFQGGSICNKSSFNQNDPKCTLQNLTVGQTYTYQIKADQCSAPVRGTIIAR